MTAAHHPRIRRRRRIRIVKRLAQLARLADMLYPKAVAANPDFGLLTREEFAEAMRNPGFRVLVWHAALLEDAQRQELPAAA